MTQAPDPAGRPNTVPWPPIIFVVAAILAVLLGRLYQPGIPLPAGLATVLGAGVMLAGLGLDIAAMVVMHRHRANILPHRAATALVTSGPFAISRNPIYLGNTLLLTGAALVFGNAWFLAAALAAALVVAKLAIEREEAHLAALFGTAWHDYARRTPRWLRLRP